ncbi:DUF7159 family protein, partial [Mycolicibacterium stellerae]|uniref:DUF7159 family protein n=1 Tax=Mycolicibacterium stellerae TaxID=2358193 RepID=UPI0019D13D5B
MDLVLGLSVTSTAVRWVLVEGVTGDGDAVDRGALDIVEGVEFDAEALLTVLLDANEAVVENGVHAVGVTWTPAGEPIAGPIVEALQDRGVHNAISVSESEAAEALASGIADIGGYENVAVCVFEPGYTMVAVVNADGVTAEPQNLPDDVELAASVIALDLNDRQLDAIFVVGSADLDPIVASMDTVAAAPVISSAEADMAMSRGAAVASAMAVNSLAGGPTAMMRLRGMSRTSVLASVLVAAGVTLVISLSVVLGLQATSDPPSETKNASATGEQLKETPVPSKARAAMAAPKVEQPPVAKPAPAARPAPPEPAAPPVAQTMVAAPPAPAPPRASPPRPPATRSCSPPPTAYRRPRTRTSEPS